jgi:hypothetical protein
MTMATPNLTEQALDDPCSVFETPEAVLASDQLTAADKRAVLERWRQLAGGESQAEDREESNLATRLFRALSFLDTESGTRKTTHDQGFYTSIGDIGQDEPKKG